MVLNIGTYAFAFVRRFNDKQMIDCVHLVLYVPIYWYDKYSFFFKNKLFDYHRRFVPFYLTHMTKRLPYYRLSYKDGFQRKKSITKYPIRYAFTQLHYSLLNGCLNQCTYWLSELVCSGYTDQLWEFVFQFHSMYVHIFFPNMIIDISVKFKEYVFIKGTTRSIELRNKVSVREIGRAHV
jgi:hypothetical protein